MKSSTVLLIAILSVICADSARILVLEPFGSKSHKNAFVPLIHELANRGHHVTFLTTYPTPEFANHSNIREILNPPLDLDKLGVNFFKMQLESSLSSKLQIPFMMLDLTRYVASSTYSNTEMQKLLLDDRFDLLMISQAFGDLCYPFVWHFKTPFILISPNAMLPGSGTLMGDNEHSEAVPCLFTSLTDRMSFYERIVNTLAIAASVYVGQPVVMSLMQSFAREYFPEAPPLREVHRNVSMMFIHSHPVFNYPRVLPPDVVEVGAMHCRPAKPLPEKIENFVAGAPEGFIVFAIGSAIPMKDMPLQILDSFVEAFSRLPQRVLWQWKGPKLANVSGNVLLMDWLPQQDLLGHENCKAFITHGGLNSIQEAVYHGVPILGLPFGTDQKVNLGMSIRQGYAIQLEWNDITTDSLLDNIHELLRNSKYATNAKRLQRILRDQPQTPLERAVFWTEHVLRHGGTDHLRLASRDLNLLQRLGIDVFFVILSFLLLVMATCAGCVKVCCCRRKHPIVQKAKLS